MGLLIFTFIFELWQILFSHTLLWAGVPSFFFFSTTQSGIPYIYARSLVDFYQTVWTAYFFVTFFSA